MKLQIIIDEAQPILPEQLAALKLKWRPANEIERIDIPKHGMSYVQYVAVADRLGELVLFATPSPTLMTILTSRGKPFLIFHAGPQVSSRDRLDTELANLLPPKQTSSAWSSIGNHTGLINQPPLNCDIGRTIWKS
jgi:hypothetical protein